MQRIGLWQILGTSLTRVPATSIDLEESLEEWIACDPSLIQANLVIIARQLTTEAVDSISSALIPKGVGRSSRSSGAP